MAYPFYPTYTNPYQQIYQSIPQQIPQQPQASIANQSGIIWVSGAQEAAMYPIAPNAAVALWEKSGKVIYLKQADATGKPTMTIYDLVERKVDASEKQDNISDEYVRKSDLASVIASIKTDIDTMKSDLYGAVGRKRTVKKQEPEDDD